MRIGSRPQHGLAYLVLLIAVAIIGITAASAITAGARLARRSAEAELFAIGTDFRNALQGYSRGTLDGPKELHDLERDPRLPQPRRYLRRVPVDPLSGSREWGLERDPQGRIIGVYSLARGVPIKRSGFEKPFEQFENAESYQDWVFGPGAPSGLGNPGRVGNNAARN